MTNYNENNQNDHDHFGCTELLIGIALIAFVMILLSVWP